MPIKHFGKTTLGQGGLVTTFYYIALGIQVTDILTMQIDTEN